MTTTTNLGLPIYGASDVPKWDDTNTPFQNVDSKVAIKDMLNNFTASIHVMSDDLDSTETRATAVWGQNIKLVDKNDVRVGYIRPHYNTDGSVDLDITAPKGKVYINGQIAKTETVLKVTYDGVKTVGQALAELKALLTNSGLSLTGESYIVNQGAAVFKCTSVWGTFCYNYISTTQLVITEIDLTKSTPINDGVRVNIDGTNSYINFNTDIGTSGNTIDLHIIHA